MAEDRSEPRSVGSSMRALSHPQASGKGLLFGLSTVSHTLPTLSRDPEGPHLSHHGNGCLSSGLCDAVLHQVEHVLVIEQADQVEGAEAGGAAQREVADHHGAGGWADRGWGGLPGSTGLQAGKKPGFSGGPQDS